MNAQTQATIGLASMVLMLTLGASEGTSHLLRKHGPPAARVSSMAPDFDLCDTQGRHWHLRRLRGRPVLLVFVCGCGDCHRLLAALGRAPGAGARVLVISSIAPTDLTRLIADCGTRFPALFDPFGKTAAAYSSLTCPRLWALDSRQVIRYTNKAGQSRPAGVIAPALASVGLSHPSAAGRGGRPSTPST